MRKANNIQTLQNYFLIATPAMAGSFWEDAVIYICEHDQHEGTMGIMINQPAQDVTFDEITKDMAIPSSKYNQAPIILTGGPVEVNRGFILHDDGYSHESTLDLAPHIHLTATTEIVGKIAQGKAPENLNFCLGYAGWDAGQLEDEIAENSWLMMEAEPDIMYKTPVTERHQACLARLGIDADASRMSAIAGHA